MSRIELDALDRGSVEWACEALTESKAFDFGTAANTDVLLLVGRLQVNLEILLRILDGGER